MKQIRYISFFILTIFLSTQYCQVLNSPSIFQKILNDTSHYYSFQDRYKKLNSVLPVKRSKNNSFVYPLEAGNYWEYIEKDESTFQEQTSTYAFSITRSVTNDTVMPNQLHYKKITHHHWANSVNYSDTYEYQRVDSSGKVYQYYNESDCLMYNFSLTVGDTYPSCIENLFWRIIDEYYFDVGIDTLLAIEFGLFDSLDNIYTESIVVDKIGLVFYRGNIARYGAYPQGDLYGGLIGDVKYGDFLVTDTADWRAFYPLNSNDFWRYTGYDSALRYVYAEKIVGDTVMADGNTYKIRENRDLSKAGSAYSYERIADNAVFFWNSLKNNSAPKYKFSTCVGDTFNLTNGHTLRICDKSNYIKLREYPDVLYHVMCFGRGLGLVSEVSELWHRDLAGANIDGQVYGDTVLQIFNDSKTMSVHEVTLQSFPNPFNGQSKIFLRLIRESAVKLDVCNMMGESVKTLTNGDYKAGDYSFVWEGKNDCGKLVASGIYLYRLIINHSSIKILKTIMLK